MAGHLRKGNEWYGTLRVRFSYFKVALKSKFNVSCALPTSLGNSGVLLYVNLIKYIICIFLTKKEGNLTDLEKVRYCLKYA